MCFLIPNDLIQFYFISSNVTMANGSREILESLTPTANQWRSVTVKFKDLWRESLDRNVQDWHNISLLSLKEAL
jgi:hypothetical protein